MKHGRADLTTEAVIALDPWPRCEVERRFCDSPGSGAKGILEGRRASGNVMKYLLMGTSSNFGNMFSMAAASVFLPFLPIPPTQILRNNFLYDLAQVTTRSDNVDET